MIFAMAIPSGRILASVLRDPDVDMTQKHAAIMTETDPATFCRMLQDKGPFVLERLEKLPYKAVAKFWRLWFFAFLDQDMQEMRAEKLVMARADLRPAERKEEAI